MTEEKKVDGPTWKNRRRYLLFLTAFCIKIITYIAYHSTLGDLDTETAQTIVTMAFWTLILCFGTYVGGATWQDINLGNIKK